MFFVVDVVAFLAFMAAIVALGIWAIVTQRPEDGISPLVAEPRRRGTATGQRRRSGRLPARRAAIRGRARSRYWRCSPR